MHSQNNKELATTELTGLAAYLFRDGLLDFTTAKSVIDKAQQDGVSLTTYLVRAGILSNQCLLQYCAENFGLPIFDLTNYDATWSQDAVVNSELISRYRVIPLNRDQYHLHLGITDPTNHTAITAISFHTGLRVRPVLVSENELDKVINTYYRPTMLSSQLESALAKINPLEEQAVQQDRDDHNDEPVSEFVDQLIQDAIQKNVSDIHIEPYEDYCRIRFRRDGLLYEAATLPTHLSSRVTTRLKIMANLNIAERRLPQDGRIQLQKEFKIDIRINTCPTLCNEKIVLRLLDTKKMNVDIDSLGFTEAQKKLFLAELSKPQGLVLVTGPTGSGKTVTLYSALHYLNKIEKNISTVEDPVEIELSGINQVNIHPKIGLDFATVMRTFLRQDPDIIMLGEIRDIETATIAMQAAQTGHLVLSTLHTNNAIETISRLRAMGVAAYHLAHSVSLIIAQRLVRKLCPLCKQPENLPIGLHDIAYRAIGCEHCYQGYEGRIGIFELLPITEQTAQSILSGSEVVEMLAQVKNEGWTLLWDAGYEKVRSGVTSYSEIIRVMGR